MWANKLSLTRSLLPSSAHARSLDVSPFSHSFFSSLLLLCSRRYRPRNNRRTRLSPSRSLLHFGALETDDDKMTLYNTACCTCKSTCSSEDRSCMIFSLIYISFVRSLSLSLSLSLSRNQTNQQFFFFLYYLFSKSPTDLCIHSVPRT